MSDPKLPRLRFLEYDSRPTPKTEHYCVACQRDLDPTLPSRTVRITAEMMVVHPEDKPPATASLWSLGPDCAAKLGLEWSVPAAPVSTSKKTKAGKSPTRLLTQ